MPHVICAWCHEPRNPSPGPCTFCGRLRGWRGWRGLIQATGERLWRETWGGFAGLVGGLVEGLGWMLWE